MTKRHNTTLCPIRRVAVAANLMELGAERERERTLFVNLKMICFASDIHHGTLTSEPALQSQALVPQSFWSYHWAALAGAFVKAPKRDGTG